MQAPRPTILSPSLSFHMTRTGRMWSPHTMTFFACKKNRWRPWCAGELEFFAQLFSNFFVYYLKLSLTFCNANRKNFKKPKALNEASEELDTRKQSRIHTPFLKNFTPLGIQHPHGQPEVGSHGGRLHKMLQR